MMYGREKSGSAIVAGKPTNKAERSAAEPVEPRAEAKGNAGQQSTHRAQYRERVSKALAHIRQHIVAVDTRGGSHMRESCTYGSVRGAQGNSRPYRDRREFIALLAGGTMWPLGAEGIRDAACRFSASPSNFAGALWSVKFAILLAFQTGYAGREIPANPTSQSMRHQPHKEETNGSPERPLMLLPIRPSCG